MLRFSSEREGRWSQTTLERTTRLARGTSKELNGLDAKDAVVGEEGDGQRHTTRARVGFLESGAAVFGYGLVRKGRSGRRRGVGVARKSGPVGD